MLVVEGSCSLTTFFLELTAHHIFLELTAHHIQSISYSIREHNNKPNEESMRVSMIRLASLFFLGINMHVSTTGGTSCLVVAS
jgi:hypothetical protein